MMNRPRFVSGVAVGFVAMPFTIKAQQAGKVPRIGYLGGNRADVSQPSLAAFRQGLREHGWIDGQNIVVEARLAEGRADQLPVVAAELIHRKVDVIVTTSSATTWAAKDATKSIPIVMGVSADALGKGLVTSPRASGREHHRDDLPGRTRSGRQTAGAAKGSGSGRVPRGCAHELDEPIARDANGI